MSPSPRPTFVVPVSRLGRGHDAGTVTAGLISSSESLSPGAAVSRWVQPVDGPPPVTHIVVAGGPGEAAGPETRHLLFAPLTEG
jgi:hypothetical protein